MIKYSVFLIIILINVACNQEPKSLPSTDIKTINLTSIRWGADDLQELSHKMVQNILASNKIDFTKDKTYFFGNIRNDTHDQIDLKTLQNKIISALLKSSKFTFIEKDKTRADYIFKGKITSIFKKNTNTKNMFFNFNLTLTNTKTLVIVWSEDIKIRKLYKRSLLSW